MEERELYKVLSVEKRGQITFRYNAVLETFEFAPHCGLWRFDVYYNTRKYRLRVSVEAKDELDAYIQGQKYLDMLKAGYERRIKKKEQTK